MKITLNRLEALQATLPAPKPKPQYNGCLTPAQLQLQIVRSSSMASYKVFGYRQYLAIEPCEFEVEAVSEEEAISMVSTSPDKYYAYAGTMKKVTQVEYLPDFVAYDQTPRFAAYDANGLLYAYTEKPTWDSKVNEWVVGSRVHFAGLRVHGLAFQGVDEVPAGCLLLTNPKEF